MKHYEATGHPVSIKLGSIKREGYADMYCYKHDEEQKDPDLASHLRHWGINIEEREQTEKSLTELQIDQNMRWEFNMTSEDGRNLKPLFGKELTGLKNLGNSCYLASILQCLFSLPEFKQRYNIEDELPTVMDPATDLETQLRKIADGLNSGRYSVPDKMPNATQDENSIHYQKGLAPAMLKALIGKGHEEFSTMRQQDAFELLQHLFKIIDRSQHPEPLKNPVSFFKFALEQRLQCSSCNKVRYTSNNQENLGVNVPIRRINQTTQTSEGGEAQVDQFETVTLEECLDIFTAPEQIEYTCAACGGTAGATKYEYHLVGRKGFLLTLNQTNQVQDISKRFGC